MEINKDDTKENKSFDKKLESPSLKKNIVFSVIIQAITFLVPLIVSPYISRVLGANGLGQYSYALSILSYFSAFVTFGFVTYGTRAISQCRDSKEKVSQVFWNIIFCRLVLLSISTLLYLILFFSNAFGSKANSQIFLILLISLIGNCFDLTFFYQGKENFKMLSGISASVKLISLICIFVFVKKSDDVLIYTFIKSGEVGLLSLLMLVFCIRHLQRPKIKEIHLLKTFKEGILFFFPVISSTISGYIDQTMIGYISNMEEVGYYQAGHRITSTVISLVLAISPVMLSRISYLYSVNKQEEIRIKTIKMFETFFLVAIPAVVGLYSTASYLIPAFFGDEFYPTVELMYFLIPNILFSSCVSLLGTAYYYPSNKAKFPSIFLVIGTIVNIITNIFAIQYFGSKGAAFTTSFTSFIVLCLYIWFSRKSIDYLSIVKKIIKPLIASAVMAGGLVSLWLLLRNTGISLIVLSICEVVLGIIIYVIMIIILRESLIMSLLGLLKNKLRGNKK